MLKPTTKQKPPPYPRPVEHVSADEISFSLEELRHHNRLDKRNGSHQSGKHDAEVEAERRTAKRRRIEDHAAAYLRGEPLYIMSAQLKGPFGKSWKNPWAKKKSNRLRVVNQSRIAEVPETAKTSYITVEDVREKGVVLPEVKKRNNALESVNQVDNADQWSSNAVVPPTSPIMTSPCRSLDKATTPKPGEIKSTRIRDWLKTNEKYLNQPEALPIASPTPTMTSRVDDTAPVRSRFFGLQSPTTTGRAAEDNPAAVLIQYEPIKSENRSLFRQVERDRPVIHSEAHNETGRITTSSEIRHELHTDQAEIDKSINVSKAASATMNDKKVPLHVAPPDANFSPFEYRRANTKKSVDLKSGINEQRYTDDVLGSHPGVLKLAPIQSPNSHAEEEAQPVAEEPQQDATAAKTSDVHVQLTESFGNGNPSSEEEHAKQDREVGHVDQEAIKSVHVEQGGARSSAHQQSRPLPSTFTSDVNTADLLPSAQRPPELVPTLSSGLREDIVLEDKKHDEPDLPDDQASDFTPIELVSDNDITPNKDISEVEARTLGVSSSPHRIIAQKDIPLVPSSPIVPKSTQEMLAGITPFTLSTIKKRTRDTMQETPTTATKKKRKTASFAPDLHSSTSSHGSIQSTMRGKISKKLSSPPPLIVKDSMCMDIDLSENNHPLSAPIQPMKKTILKPMSSSPSFLRQSRLSLFSDYDHDHHRQVTTTITAATSESAIPVGSGQNKNNGEGDMGENVYDLDAEISEIGSFLDPWQVDKEIEEMAA